MATYTTYSDAGLVTKAAYTALPDAGTVTKATYTRVPDAATMTKATHTRASDAGAMNKAYRQQKQFAIQGFMMRVLPCTSQIISIKCTHYLP